MRYQDFKCPWIELERLRKIADENRDKYWSVGILPIDMEEIIELKLFLNIEPVPDLKANFDMLAFLKADLSGIVVDYKCFLMDNFSNPLRFALAHELGHYFLHKKLYSKFPFTTPEEWKNFMINLPEAEYRAFEWQANEFAGRFLVPYPVLQRKIEETLELIKEQKLVGYLKKNPDIVLSRVSPRLRSFFGVSEEVIERRVKGEGLWPPRMPV